MLGSTEPAQFSVPHGMGENSLLSAFEIFTERRYDDGTALMPIVNSQVQLPILRTLVPYQDGQYQNLAPDAGVGLPPDWYCNLFRLDGWI